MYNRHQILKVIEPQSKLDKTKTIVSKFFITSDYYHIIVMFKGRDFFKAINDLQPLLYFVSVSYEYKFRHCTLTLTANATL